MKKAVLILLSILLLYGTFGCAKNVPAVPERTSHVDATAGFSPASDENAFVRISENDRFVLSANLKTGEASVEDKRNGMTWFTNPEDKFEDTLASGFYKNSLLSVITVVYSTAQSVDMTCGGYLSSVQKKGMYYRMEPDGSIVFLFDFPNEQFRIPVRFAIEEDRFIAQILTDGILEYGPNKIKTIDFLPFFGAGKNTEDGYLLVPDGSGALVRFNNERLTARTYSQGLYGFDNGTNDKTMGGFALTGYFTLSQNAYLPVYGVNRGDQGFLAVLSQGSARASVNANVADKYSTYNAAWTTYAYRTTGTVRQTQKDGTEQVVTIGEKNLETYADYEVAFYFLDRGRATYADMAAKYRSYLMENEGLKPRVIEKASIPLYLDIYGHIKKTKSVLGIPKDVKITTASISDAETILNTLEQDGVDRIILKYNHWADNSFYGKLPVTAKVDSRVGTLERMQKLQERLDNAGGGLYLSADLINVYRSGRGINQYRDALQSVANTVQRQYVFRLDSAMIDSRYDPWYLLRLGSVGRVFRQYANNLKEAGIAGAALDTIGEKLYSELGTSGTGRNQALLIMREAVKDTEETVGSVLLTGANGYAANYASHLLITPAKSSGYDMEDESVPFYQMVYHGLTSYSLRASNLSSNPHDLTLTCMEYGAYPLFSIVYENADELIGSRLNAIYSADFTEWRPYIIEQYQQINSVLSRVQSAQITTHTISGGSVRCTGYDNGVMVYVNYGNTAAEVDGLTVPAKGYAALQNGEIYASGIASGD